MNQISTDATSETITREQIVCLRVEAKQAGDRAMADACGQALEGDEASIRRCEKAIASARAAGRISTWTVGAKHGAYGIDGAETFVGSEADANSEASRIAAKAGHGWAPYAQQSETAIAIADDRASRSAITRSEARRLYRAGKNFGLGYVPYLDEETEADTVLDAIKASESNGWNIVHSSDATDDVAVLVNGDGEYLAIGGDAMGRCAWAIPLSDVPTDSQINVAPITLSDSANVYLPDAHPRRFFPARLNRSDRWNGWAVPYFEQDEARRMLAFMADDKVISAFSETDDGCFVTYDIDDDAKEFPQTWHPELVKVDDGSEWTAVSLWPIGAGSWTWLEQDRA